MIDVSIIIPTYNRLTYLKEAIDSCLKQNLLGSDQIHVIVVDDGSTDGTLQTLIKTYQLKSGTTKGIFANDRLTVISEKNRERGAARNTGAHFAITNFKSSWLLFLDADDALAPDSLSQFLERLKKAPGNLKPVAVYANLISWDGRSFGRKRFLRALPEGDLSKRVLTQATLSIGTTLIAADIFDKLGGFSEDRDMSGSEDWEFWVRLAREGTILYSAHISLWYRRHVENTSAARFEKSITAAMAEIREKAPGMNAGSLLITGFLWIAGSYNMEGNRLMARSYLAKAYSVNSRIIFSPRWLRLWLSIRLRTLFKS